MAIRLCWLRVNLLLTMHAHRQIISTRLGLELHASSSPSVSITLHHVSLHLRPRLSFALTEPAACQSRLLLEPLLAVKA